MTDNADVNVLAIDLLATISDLAKQAQSGKALIYAGIVEDWLQKLLIHHMRPLSNTMLQRLFEGYGPVSSFSGRADIAFAFDLISEEVFQDLRIIKDIRNQFAHTVDPVHFDSKEIVESCRRFTSWREGVDNEHLFYERAAWCAMQMQHRIEKSLLANALSDEPKPLS
jgi:hypothetical protein